MESPPVPSKVNVKRSAILLGLFFVLIFLLSGSIATFANTGNLGSFLTLSGTAFAQGSTGPSFSLGATTPGCPFGDYFTSSLTINFPGGAMTTYNFITPSLCGTTLTPPFPSLSTFNVGTVYLHFTGTVSTASGGSVGTFSVSNSYVVCTTLVNGQCPSVGVPEFPIASLSSLLLIALLLPAVFLMGRKFRAVQTPLV